MAQLSIRMGWAPAVIEAYLRDVESIYLRYGGPDDVQPHNQRALAAELERAQSVFMSCVEVQSSNEPGVV